MVIKLRLTNLHDMNDRGLNENPRFLRVGSRAANLILEIGRAIEDVHFGLARPGLAVRFGIQGGRAFLERKEMALRNQELKRLKQRRLVVIDKIGDSYLVKFSQRGFEEYMMQLSQRACALPEGQVCLLSFDVPESNRLIRDYIRRLLKRMGFKQMHRSVWLSRKDIGVSIAEILSSRYRSDNWFKVYLGAEL